MSIEDTMTSLAACLCVQIETDGSPGVCFCGVVPGIAAAAPYMRDCSDNQCGMAWVRLITAYPSDSVGTASTVVSNCEKMTGIDLEIGIMRCFTPVDVRGNGPSAETLEQITKQTTKDTMTMWRALFCCDAIDNDMFVLGAYTPLGPEGDMVGGSWNLSVMVD